MDSIRDWVGRCPPPYLMFWLLSSLSLWLPIISSAFLLCSLPRIFASSQFIMWLALATWSDMADLCSRQGHLERPLLKDCQWFDAVSTSNLEVYKFWGWWILTYFIFGHGESSLNNIWSMVNLERTCVFLFYYFPCLKTNLDLEKTNQLGESSPNFIFAVVNLDPIILKKRWIDDEFWPNNFVEKVKRGEDLRLVGSRCPLTRALVCSFWWSLPT